MRFSPTTQLVLFMFLSFSVVLGTMVVLFRPGPTGRREVSPTESSATSRKALAVSPVPDSGGSRPEASVLKTGVGDDSAGPKGSDDIRLLRQEVEGQLKSQLILEEQKIQYLAKLCERMEPGKAAQTLAPLDDAAVRRILSQVDKDTALRIQAVLVRLRKSNE